MKKELKFGILISTSIALSLSPCGNSKANDGESVEGVQNELMKSSSYTYEMPIGEKVIEYEHKLPYIEPKPVEQKVTVKNVEPTKTESVEETKIEDSSDLGTFNVSWYISGCKGCSGITATGIDVRTTTKYQGYNIAASDWKVIPPYSIIEVEGYGKFIIMDKGGAIKGKKLDLLTGTTKQAYANGRQHLNVKVLRWGKGE